jgi:hypothetical protein
MVETPVVAVVEAAPVVATAIESESVAMPVLDLGDLILVETDGAALALEANKTVNLTPVGLRRNEYLALLPVVEEKDSLPLQQVETIK